MVFLKHSQIAIHLKGDETLTADYSWAFNLNRKAKTLRKKSAKILNIHDFCGQNYYLKKKSRSEVDLIN